jgi:hypothetical protein
LTYNFEVCYNRNMITAYNILKENTSLLLSAQVQDHIERGWQPYGNLNIFSYGSFNWYYQTMVKYGSTANTLGN